MKDAEEVHKMVGTEPAIWSRLAQERRFTAYVVTHLQVDQIKNMAREADFSSSEPGWSLEQAFYREAGQALESILKAVLAKHVCINKRPNIPMTHDLSMLWSEAGLKDLVPEDMKRLRLFSRAIIWFGRYPAAKNSKVAQAENLALREPPEDVSSLGWNDFERIFNHIKEHYQFAP